MALEFFGCHIDTSDPILSDPKFDRTSICGKKLLLLHERANNLVCRWMRVLGWDLRVMRHEIG